MKNEEYETLKSVNNIISKNPEFIADLNNSIVNHFSEKATVSREISGNYYCLMTMLMQVILRNKKIVLTKVEFKTISHIVNTLLEGKSHCPAESNFHERFKMGKFKDA